MAGRAHPASGLDPAIAEAPGPRARGFALPEGRRRVVTGDLMGPLIIGIADFTWRAGSLTFTGIALGSLAALVIYHGMRLLGASDGITKGSAGSAGPAAARR